MNSSSGENGFFVRQGYTSFSRVDMLPAEESDGPFRDLRFVEEDIIAPRLGDYIQVFDGFQGGIIRFKFFE